MHFHTQLGYWGWTFQSINKPSNTTNIYTNPLYLQEYISDLSIMLWLEYYSQSLDRIRRSSRYYCRPIHWGTRNSTNTKDFSYRGGVFTGDIAEHVRSPFNGKIEFNDNLVYPTRTCNGHPTYLCHNNLSITIDGQDQVKKLTIPPKSLILVQNDQYVESEQIIVEVRARKSSFKEKVRKNIYFDLEGEMHWSTNVCHAPEYVHGNVHPILRTGYL
jgi:hypothetical protein